jgi:hypothetical protein
VSLFLIVLTDTARAIPTAITLKFHNPIRRSALGPNAEKLKPEATAIHHGTNAKLTQNSVIFGSNCRRTSSAATTLTSEMIDQSGKYTQASPQ